MSPLDDESLAAALAELPGWQQEEDAIRKTYRFESFREAMKFVRRIADLAEACDHHPEIRIRYRDVVLRVTTHEAGGVTARDLDLARRIDA